MAKINIISEKRYGQYEYNNGTVNTSGNYVKNGLENSLQTISGTCYSTGEEKVFYGSFNGKLSDGEEKKMKYAIYETQPEYKEIIEGVIKEIENKI